MDDALRAFGGGGARVEVLDGLHVGSQPTSTGSLRQLVCAADVEPGTHILRVPRRLVLSTTKSLSAPLRRALSEICGRGGIPPFLCEVFMLAIELVTTQDPAWAFYREHMLPDESDCEHSADAFTPGELAALQSTTLVERITTSQRHLNTLYNELPWGAEGMPARFGHARFVWAVHCVRSRAFNVCEQGAEANDGGALIVVPFVDLVNHSSEPNVRAEFHTDDNTCVLVCTRHVPAGTPLVRDYSHQGHLPLSNERMLYTYGFVPADGNPHDEVYIDFRDEYMAVLEHARATPASTPADATGSDGPGPAEQKGGGEAAHRRLQLLTAIGGGVEGRARGFAAIRAVDVPEPPHDGPPSLSSPALRVARALVATDAELQQPSAIALLHAGRAVSRDNELRASRLLWTKLVTTLREYPTNAAEDASLLRRATSEPNPGAEAGADEMSARMVCALQLRLGHKGLLERALVHYARHRKELVRM